MKISEAKAEDGTEGDNKDGVHEKDQDDARGAGSGAKVNETAVDEEDEEEPADDGEVNDAKGNVSVK